ncbi:MAG: hypothetical protein ACE5JZ_11200 [Kiloniellales bacterium]
MRVFLLLLLAGLVGGGVFLAMWEIPPPSARVEQVISDDRFAR